MIGLVGVMVVIACCFGVFFYMQCLAFCGCLCVLCFGFYCAGSLVLVLLVWLF